MTKIAIILTQGFADWEYALLAGAGGAFYGQEIRFFAPTVGEVLSMGGLAAQVAHSFEGIAQWSPDAVVVIGSAIWETDDAPDIGALLQSHHSGGGVVAGICGGTLALARAGLLEKTTHTSNAPDYLTDNATGYDGSIHYRQSASAISADRVITAPGTAPASFAAAIFSSVGVDPDAVEQFRTMLAAEHTPPSSE